MGELTAQGTIPRMSFTLLFKVSRNQQNPAQTQHAVDRTRDALDRYIWTDKVLQNDLRGMKAPYFEIIGWAKYFYRCSPVISTVQDAYQNIPSELKTSPMVISAAPNPSYLYSPCVGRGLVLIWATEKHSGT